MTAGADVTRLLQAHQDGNKSVLDELFPLVYDELRRMAAHCLSAERAEHTLQATALVHEAYLRLAGRIPPSGRIARIFSVSRRR